MWKGQRCYVSVLRSRKMTELEIEDAKLRELCPDEGWCETIQRFFNERTIEIWRNECVSRPCPRRNYFIRDWLEKVGLEVPAIYRKLTLGAVMEAARVGQLNPNTKIGMTRTKLEQDSNMKPEKKTGCTPCAKAQAQKKPGIREKVIGVTKSGVKFVKSGFKKADKKIYRERIDICLGCDQKYYDTFGKLRCKSCGCFLRLKARMACESCPLANPKWGPTSDCEDGV